MELNDKLFRIFIIIISIAFLIVYYEGTQNGRYIFYTSDNAMVDSRTGKMYGFNTETKKWIFVDPLAKSKQ
jgi:hypothetical protein